MAVVIEGCHSCMTARGIKKNQAKPITSTFRGQFKENPWYQMRVCQK